MRVLRNLDLAVDIVNEEGAIILKKYDNLNFYLKKIANGKIYNYKARNQLNLLKKQYPDMNAGRDKIKFAHAYRDRKKPAKRTE